MTNTFISLIANAVGGSNVQYQFWLYNSVTSTWNQLQAYSAQNICPWLPTTAGNYYLSVTAWDTIIGTQVNTTAWYAITNGAPLSAVAIFTSPALPQPINTPITLTAAATGGTNVQYQFWVYNASATTWSQLQTYSATATCAWLPTTPGYYLLSATAHDNSNGITVNQTQWYLVNPVLTVFVSCNPALPVAVDTPITLAAGSTGSMNAQYQFWIYNPNATPTWSQLQGYSSYSTCCWTPVTTGTYFIFVTVLDTVTGMIATVDVPYTINDCLTAVSVTPSLAAPQTAKTPITLTAAATGGGSVQYQFWLYNPTAAQPWSLLQAYSASATYLWTPAATGNYVLSITAYDTSNGTAVNTMLNYTIDVGVIWHGDLAGAKRCTFC